MEQQSYATRFGSLASYEKGGVEIINDDPRHYAFSNVFEVASKAAAYEKTAVGKNMEYVVEAIRAEGTSAWRATAHDEFALVLDGEVEVRFLEPDEALLASDAEGSITLGHAPSGTPMGRVVIRRGHMALLPAGCAYQFSAETPSVILQQTMAGPDTLFRWSEICQSL